MSVNRQLLKKITKESNDFFKFVQYDFRESEEYEGKIISADFKESNFGRRFVVKVILDKYSEREFCLSIPVDNAKGSLFFRFCADMELLTTKGANLQKLTKDQRKIFAKMRSSQDGTYFVNKLRWKNEEEEDAEDEEEDEEVDEEEET